jgi:hypothetical protein
MEGTASNLVSNAAPAGGRRHRSRRHSGKKLRLVKKKTVRRMLKKMGLKMRGGAGEPAPSTEADSAPAAPMGGRRRRKSKKGLFGL